MDTKDFIIENGTLVDYTGQGETVIIPDGVTEIGQGAFRNCRNLTNITIPDSVRKIERLQRLQQPYQHRYPIQGHFCRLGCFYGL